MELKNKYSGISHLVGLIAYLVGLYNMFVFEFSDSLSIDVLSFLGILITFYCGYILYQKKDGRTYLITSGVFKYTRHPMYTGVALMYLQFLNPDNYSLISFWVFTAVHYSALIIGGYLQEKETIERFGDEAIEYYKKTPRLFIFYPLYFFRKLAKN